MTEWQPIETAPRDGWFLFWIPGAEIPGVGRLNSKGNVVTEENAVGYATHWMPLPSPPDT